MAVIQRGFDASALMEIACGYDTIAGEVRGKAVQGSPGQPVGGTEVVFSLYKVVSIQDFLDSLNLSGSMSIQAEFGKGGAKAQFAKSIKIHDYSVYIAVAVTVKTGTTILEDPELKPAAATLLLSNSEQFRKTYGDEYLAGITSGGEFYALLEIITNDRTEQQQASADISGGDLLGANQGEAHFASSLSQVVSKYQLRVHSFQQGGSDPNVAVTPETLVQKAVGFPSTVSGANVFPYIATFQTYDALTLPASANLIDIQNQRDVLDRLGTYRNRYLSVIDSVDYVLSHPEQYAAFDSAALTTRRNQLSVAYNQIISAASKCLSNYTQCALPATLSDPVVQLPEWLVKTDQQNVTAAKQAYQMVQQHAEVCRQYAQRVLDIAVHIQPGAGGKASADEAANQYKLAADEAQQVSTAATQAATAASTTPAAQPFASQAQAIEADIKQLLGTANSKLDDIHKKGYTPYWTAPQTLYLDAYQLGPNVVWSSWSIVWGNHPPASQGHVDLSSLAVDPSGGPLELEIVPTGQITNHLVNDNQNVHQDIYNAALLGPSFYASFQLDYNKIPDYYSLTFSIGGSMAAVGNNVSLYFNKYAYVEIVLRSKASGLQCQLVLNIYNTRTVPVSPTHLLPSPYLNAHFNKVD